jgi:hypothetical protein
MILIGLGYRAQNGKDTAGEAIVNYFNAKRQQQIGHELKPSTPEARIFKFADALYRVCREEYGMTLKDALLLQKVGNGRRLEFGDEYWIKKLDDSLKGFNGIAVITDTRYWNEGDYVKSKRGYLGEVTRLNQDGSVYISPDRDPNFVSETQLHNYNFDFHIRTKSAALTAEMGITVAEYLRGLAS